MAKETKRDLEQAVREKVSPLLEESLEKNLGFSIPKMEADLTDKITTSALSVYFPLDTTFAEAKKVFKAEFFKRELTFHLGNISELAKNLDIDRRSIHRVIKDLEIDLEDMRHKPSAPKEYKEGLIKQAIKGTLDEYKEVIQPQKMQKLYGEAPKLSRNIAKFIPHKEHTWKQAETEFEKQFLTHSLQENNWNVSKAALQIDIRVETLHRKIKKLSLKK